MLDHLPHHVLLEILKRIPVNSLVKWTSVSKTWYSLINNSDLIYSHLENSISRNTKDPHIVRLVPDNDLGYCLYFESIESHEHFHKQLILPPVFSHGNLDLIGYSNGIFCYALSHDGGYYWYVLWNPCIQKYFILPRSNYENHSTVSFVFDSNVNDFKVFAETRSFEFELFSLRNRSWKIISVSDSNVVCSEKYTFVKGVIYFMGFEYEKENLKKYYIFGFNLADEDFHKILLPASLGSSDYLVLIQYGTTSIAVVAYYTKKLELWFMEEISVLGTWKKVLLEMSHMWHDVFGVWKDRVLFENVSGQVISFDLNSRQNKDAGLIQRRKIDIEYNSFHRYEETLALLDNGKDISILKENIGIFDHANDSDDAE